MYAYSRFCESDEDYARFTLFFLQHHQQFISSYSIDDALMHLIEHKDHSSILFVYNTEQELIGTAHYWQVSKNNSFSIDGDTVFVSSVLIIENERNSELFMSALKDFVRHIQIVMPQIKKIRAYVEPYNDYLMMLYLELTNDVEMSIFNDKVENTYEISFAQLEELLDRSNV